MGRYDVVGPCAFMVDGRAVHHTRPGAAGVHIDDCQAAPLVKAGQLAPCSLPAQATGGHADSPPVRRRTNRTPSVNI